MNEMNKQTNIKKPIFKQWWFWVIVIIVLGAIGSIGDKGKDDDKEKIISTSSTSQSEPVKELDVSSDSSSANEPESSDAARKEAQETFKKLMGDSSVIFYKNVHNDVTENWRLLVCYSSENIVDHVVDYYNAYAESEEEVHFVVNLYLKTTTVINNFGGTLYVDVHEYVDKEEHDAKALGGGMLLKSYMVDLSSGDIEEISEELSNSSNTP